MSRVTRGQLKVDGPRLRVNNTQLAIIQEAGYAAGLVPAEFLARAAVTAAKNILRELYLEQPREFERVLRRASEQARSAGAGIDAISFAALIDDIGFEDLAAMRAALLRCGITIDLPATDWKEIANG